MADSTGKTLTTFTCFGRLPAEIRLKIWEFNLPPPTINEIIYKQFTKTSDCSCDNALWTDQGQRTDIDDPWVCGRHQVFHCNRAVPANLHTCSESRTEFLKLIQTKVFEPLRIMRRKGCEKVDWNIKRGLLVDYAADIFYVRPLNLNNCSPGIDPASVFPWHWFPVVSKARTLALHANNLSSGGGDLHWIILYILKLHGAVFEEVLYIDDYNNDPDYPPIRATEEPEFQMQSSSWIPLLDNRKDRVRGRFICFWVFCEKKRKSDHRLRWAAMPRLIRNFRDPKYDAGPFNALALPRITFMHEAKREIPISPMTLDDLAYRFEKLTVSSTSDLNDTTV